MRYVVLVEQAQGNLSAYVPDLPGCVAAATTKGELLTLIREAIGLHLHALREAGQAIPAPTSTSEYVEV